jgi:hypothetical protein
MIARNTPWYVGSGEEGVQAEKDRAEAIAQQVRLKGLLEQKEKAIQAVAQERNALMQAEQRSAEAQRSLAESRLNLERNRLDLIRGQVGRAESSALAAGIRSPWENQADLDLARRLQANPESGSPEERARLAARSPFFRKLYIDMGAADPAEREFQRLFGTEVFGQGKPLQELKADEREIAAAVAKAYADAKNTYAKAFETATREGAEELGKANVELVKTMVAKAKTEILAEVAKQQMQGR